MVKRSSPWSDVELSRTSADEQNDVKEVSVNVKNNKDVATAILFTLFGGAIAVMSLGYRLGSSAEMGPGYFPLMVGVALLIIGITIGTKALLGGSDERKRITPIDWRSVIIITLAVVLFGVTLSYLGLIAATVVTIVVGSMAGREFTWKSALLSAAVMAVAAPLLFVKLLGVQFSLFPPFLVG